MKKNQSLLTVFIIAVLCVATVAHANWAAPTKAPTDGNANAPIDVGKITNSKDGGLWVNVGNNATYSFLVPYGQVGIGTTIDPNTGPVPFSELLHVNGTSYFGNTMTVNGQVSANTLNVSNQATVGSLKVSGASATGYVLTDGGGGVGVWKPAAVTGITATAPTTQNHLTKFTSNAGTSVTNSMVTDSGSQLLVSPSGDSLDFYAPPADNALGIQTLLDSHTDVNSYAGYGGGENRLLLQPVVGSVGIGIPASTQGPTAMLDVNGTVRGRSSIEADTFLAANGLGEAYPGQGGVNTKYSHSTINDSWFPYPGNNRNYFRGATLFDSGNSVNIAGILNLDTADQNIPEDGGTYRADGTLSNNVYNPGLDIVGTRTGVPSGQRKVSLWGSINQLENSDTNGNSFMSPTRIAYPPNPTGYYGLMQDNTNFHLDSMGGQIYLNWVNGTGGVNVGNGQSNYGTINAGDFCIPGNKCLSSAGATYTNPFSYTNEILYNGAGTTVNTARNVPWTGVQGAPTIPTDDGQLGNTRGYITAANIRLNWVDGIGPGGGSRISVDHAGNNASVAYADSAGYAASSGSVPVSGITGLTPTYYYAGTTVHNAKWTITSHTSNYIGNATASKVGTLPITIPGTHSFCALSGADFEHNTGGDNAESCNVYTNGSGQYVIDNSPQTFAGTVSCEAVCF